jgi:hypothetical protein
MFCFLNEENQKILAGISKFFSPTRLLGFSTKENSGLYRLFRHPSDVWDVEVSWAVDIRNPFYLFFWDAYSAFFSREMR